MSSILGLVDKDNSFSNLAVKDVVDAKLGSFQVLTAQTLTVGTLNTVKTALNNLEIDNQLAFTNASNQIVFENTKTGASITLNCQPTSVPGITYNIPDVGVNFSNFVMTDGNQTINGTKTFTSMPVFPSGGGGTLFPLIFLTNTMNQITFGSGNVVVMNVPAPAATRIYTLPDTGANSQFVMTDGAQTINGVRTYTSGIVVNATTNQLVLSSPNTVTVTAPSPAASRIYTIPDAGGAANVILSTAVSGTTTNSIQFGNATASYVPTTLSYYEEVSNIITFAGPWSPLTLTATITFMRIGDIVIVSVQAFSATASTPAIIATNSGVTAVPTRFQPTSSGVLYQPAGMYATGLSNSANVNVVVQFQNVSSNTVISCSNGVQGGAFAASGTAAVNAFTVCWTRT